MVSILNELIEELKNHKFSAGVKDVRDFYSSKKRQYPMIAIEEVSNMPNLQILGKEKFSNLAYRFEIYTRDMVIGSQAVTKRVAADMIAKELNDFLTSKYGMKRSAPPTRAPYGTDETILRSIMIYRGKIDNDTMIMYQ